MPIQYDIFEHSEFGLEMTLHLQADSKTHLLDILTELSPRKKRLELEPIGEDRWTVFFKLGSDETNAKAMLAHPDEKAWVATIILSKGHRDRLRAAIEDEVPTSISQAGPLSPPTNFHVAIRYLS